MRSDPPLPAVFSLQQAMRAGFTASRAERRVAAGRWRRLRRGAYCLEDRWQRGTPEQQHVLLAFAVHLENAASPTPYAFSHVTAAALWGLPVTRRLLASVVVRWTRCHADAPVATAT
jgi:putative AbiEi antitoxin of type IV toxin-antitoxin system